MADDAATKTDAAGASDEAAGKQAAPPKVEAQVDAADYARLQAAAAELATIKAKQAADEQAAAVKRGEADTVIAQLKADAETLRASQARASEDLALTEIHAGLRTAEARAVARALYAALPEDKRAQSLDAQVKAWVKKPDEAPAGLRAYVADAAPDAPRGSSARGSQAADKDREQHLARMKQLGFPPEDYDHFVKHVLPGLRAKK